MEDLDGAAFLQFLASRKRDIERIARATRGEQQPDDVRSELWALAHKIADRLDAAVDFLDPATQEQLIAHAYQQLVRYAETNVRYGVRLDHPAEGSDQEAGSHPLMDILTSDDARDPLALLLESEAGQQSEPEVDVHASLAAAYVCLLRHCGNRMQAVANHLLISVSYAYRRCAHARLLAIYQRPVGWPANNTDFIPGPWRQFQLGRVPIQLLLDLGERPALNFGSEGHVMPMSRPL